MIAAIATLRRWLPWVLLPALLAAVYAFGLAHLGSWQELGARQAALQGLVRAHPGVAAAGYVAIYAVIVAMMIPAGLFLTAAGGLLFGGEAGAALAVCGASTGACLLFAAARGMLAPRLARHAGSPIEALRPGLQRDGFYYVLAMRLIPVMPFWLVTLASGVCGVKPGPFALATVLGIIPLTSVYAFLGAGLGTVLAEGGTPDLSHAVSVPMLLALLGLAGLSLLPVVRRRRNPAIEARKTDSVLQPPPHRPH